MIEPMQSIRNGRPVLRLSGLIGMIGAAALLLVGAACGGEIERSQPREQADSQQQTVAREASQPQEAATDGSQSGQSQQPEQPEQSGQIEQSEAVQEQAARASESVQRQEQPEQQERGFTPIPERPTFLPRDAAATAEGIPIIRDNERPAHYGLDWSTEWGIRLIDLDELSQGAWRDAIPALSGPLYVTLEEASAYYDDAEPLVQVGVNGDVRGYPLEILTWHEIVNDVVGGMPVAVTFCPLCNTAIAFESQIGETVYQFGVSGLLRNSDLVMYDRSTESLWQQSSGRAIIGRMVGARLAYLPASVVSLGQLRDAYPDALVLSRETGWERDYGLNPYRGYDDPERGGPSASFFDRDTIDPRLPPMERVVAIEGPSGAAVAYAWSALERERVIQDSFDGIDLVVFWTPGARSALDDSVIADAREIGATAVFETSLDGAAHSFRPNADDPSGRTFVDEQTGSVWDIFGRAVAGELSGAQLTWVIHSDHFWFAWQAFHPATRVWPADADDDDQARGP